MNFLTKTKKKDQTVRVFGIEFPRWKDCPKCKSKLSCEFGLYTWRDKCIKCQLKEDKVFFKDYKPGFSIKKHRDAVAFFDTPRGTMASDGKGHLFDPKETIYDLKNDPHGWKATGKKVRPFDQKGRPND